MKSYIIIDGMNSYEDLNLLLKSMSIPSSNEEIEEVEVEGRNGSLTIKNRTYKNKKLNFSFDLKRKRNENCIDFQNRIDYIEDLLDIKKGELIIFNRPDKIFSIKHLTKDINMENDIIANVDINVICEPFMYEINEQYMDVKNNSKVFYKGTVPGEPNIKIYGSGNIQLTINSETIQINNVNEYVELDSKLLLCLNLDKTSKSRDMIGHFPLLTKGLNNISWTGNISKVEILPRTAHK